MCDKMTEEKVSYKKFIILFMIGFGIALVIFYLIGFGKITHTIASINPFFYGLGILCFLGTLISWTLRWRGFVGAAGYKVKVKDLFVSLIVGLGINNLTPVAKLGGEPVRAFMLKEKLKIPMREGFGTIVADLSLEFLISTLMLFLSFVLVTVFMNPPFWLFASMVISLIIGITGISSFFGIFSSEKILRKILNWIVNKVKRLRPSKEKILHIFERFQKTFKKGFKTKSVAGKGIYYSILMKVFDIARYSFIFLALGYRITPMYVVIAVGFMGLLMSIPATPGSLGVLEGGMVAIFTLLGVPVAIAGSVVFLERLLSFWLMLLFGGVSGSFYGIEMLRSKDEFFSLE